MEFVSRELEEILDDKARFVTPLLKQLKRDKNRVVYLVSCAQNRFVFVSEVFKDITGYSSSELLYRGLEFWIPLIHPEDKARIMETIIEGHRLLLDPTSLKEPDPMQLTYRFRRMDGQWIWLEETKWIIPVDKHVKDFVLGSLRDVTQQRLDEDVKLHQKAIASDNEDNLLKVALEYKQANKKQLLGGPQSSELEKNKSINLLTAREREVLKLIAEGFSSKQISDKLFISINTVETHRRHLLAKLNVKNSMELVKEASRSFWL
ncbi:LuxR C-terminal-related transcriptional regulator [Chryseolinea soli]|uniref:PAS domain S-box protein n=1 Tax=Chryseolinea soli TaxID=2321403 RepID=A0A385SL61_9BACT|nr:LuxR C-terminal-related transcriptional regulator [Chryseolinea soli]AYB31007.1 PAS domain S-box protein [Chryseolinea soli]